MYAIGFVGAGEMAESIVAGLLTKKSFEPSSIIASSPSGASKLKSLGVTCVHENCEVFKSAIIIILACKPYQIANVASEWKAKRTSVADLNHQLFISICVGVTLDQLRGYFGPEIHLARVMPNIPVKVIQGTFPYSLPSGSSEVAETQLLSVFSPLGMAVKVPEQHFNAAQGISGCGPAFVALFVESLVDAGVNQGLSRDLAFKLASSTVLGTGQLFRETSVGPADLKYKICSPGGVTIAGVVSLEESNFRNAVIKAHSRTVERTAEIEKCQK